MLSRETPLNRPLPFALPVPAFKGVKVHLTVYSDDVKGPAKALLELLGEWLFRGLCFPVFQRSLVSSCSEVFDFFFFRGLCSSFFQRSVLLLGEWLASSSFVFPEVCLLLGE